MQSCWQEEASAVRLAGCFIPTETCLENTSFFQELPGTCQTRRSQKPSSCLLPARRCWRHSASLLLFIEKSFKIDFFSVSVGTYMSRCASRCSLHISPQTRHGSLTLPRLRSPARAGGSEHQQNPSALEAVPVSTPRSARRSGDRARHAPQAAESQTQGDRFSLGSSSQGQERSSPRQGEVQQPLSSPSLRGMRVAFCPASAPASESPGEGPPKRHVPLPRLQARNHAPLELWLLPTPPRHSALK